MLDNIKSGDDYADILISNMGLLMEEGMPIDLIDYWAREVRTLCNIKYLKYIEGDEESFMLTDDEIMEVYNIATQKLIGDTLGDLVEKGMVRMSVDENGEVLYSATEKGLDQIK
jgi:hypothetical protein